MATRRQILANAHNKRVDKAADREIRTLETSASRAVKQIERLDERLMADPFKEINLRYTEGDGFEADPVDVEAGAVSLRLSVLSNTDGRFYHQENFHPPVHQGEVATVTPLDLLFTPWGTLVAMKIENFELSYRPKIAWIKRNAPETSAIYLIDSQNGQYYYPIATDLKGEIVAGFPKVGIFVFEPMRHVTASLILHVSGVKLSSKRGSSDTFDFECSDAGLAGDIEAAMAGTTFAAMVQDELDRQSNDAFQKINRVRRSHQRPVPKGCSAMILLALAFAGSLICIGLNLLTSI